jgi:hypothetical protein
MDCNGSDRRQWRKQGAAVGTAASRRQDPLKGRRICWEPQPVFVSEEKAAGTLAFSAGNGVVGDVLNDVDRKREQN